MAALALACQWSLRCLRLAVALSAVWALARGQPGRSFAHRPLSSGVPLVRSPVTGAVTDWRSLCEVGGWEDDIRWVTGRGLQPWCSRLEGPLPRSAT